MKLLALGVCLFAISGFGYGQVTDPLGSNRPTTYSISTLPDDLVAVDLITSKDNLMSLMQLSMGGGSITSPETGRPKIDSEMLFLMTNTLWMTKQEASGGGEFMIGYKLDVPTTPRSRPTPTAMLKFRLTYVRRAAIISMTPREDFAPSVLKELSKEPPAEEARAIDRTITISNLKQVALGLLMLSADYDDYIPYVQSTPQLFQFTMPYTKNAEVYKSKNPMGGEFRFNMSLAGVAMTAIESPSETPMVYESQAWPDGKRCVAYTDGHVKAVSEDEWQRMQPLLKLKLGRFGKPIPPGGALPDLSAPTPPPIKSKKKGGG